MKATALPLLVPLLIAQAAPAQDRTVETNWPSFRGPNASGVAEGYSTPVSWNIETGENVAWRTPIPGLSHASPIIWGDRIFLTTAVKEGEAELKVGLYGNIESVEDDSPHELQLLCLDKRSGEILWTETVWQGVPAIKRHPKSSHAVSTPATDGEHVVAFFGSEGLYCYTVDGELLWKKDFGVLDSGFYRVPSAQWGFGSSPVIHDGRVFVQCDVQENSFVAALDIQTGEELWRTPRDEVPTWGSPTVDVQGGRNQVIVNGYKHIGGYDLDTGRPLWSLEGGGDIPVPTPIVAHDMIFITNAHGRMAPILAISANVSGELSMDADAHEAMVWSEERGGNYLQTPLVYGEMLYCCRNNGVVTCFEARTGEMLYRKRLGGGSTGFSASGVAADGKLYFTSEVGEVYVVDPEDSCKTLSINDLGEICMATPAISAGALYFRTRSHLLAVSAGK